MKIWKAIPKDYKNYSHIVPADKDYRNAKLMDQWFNIAGKNTKGRYTPIEMVKEEEKKVMCNIPNYFCDLLILDNVALDALSDLLIDANVEILKIICREKQLCAINILDEFYSNEVLDCNQSEFKYFKSGKIMYVKKYVFLESKIYSKHIFMIQEGGGIFVSDEFKQRVERYELTGLKFKLIWDSEIR